METSGFKYGKTAVVYPVTQYTGFAKALFTFKVSRGSTVHAKCNIHTHKKSKVFPASIFIKLANN